MSMNKSDATIFAEAQARQHQDAPRRNAQYDNDWARVKPSFSSTEIAPLPGAKDDGGKDPMGLLPVRALRLVAKVLEWGARGTPRPDGTKGYGENNWQGVATSRYYDAALRHLHDFRAGKRYDDGPGGSGLPHLAHAACCILFMLAQTEGLDPKFPEWKEEPK